MENRNVTIKDVAKKAGVAISTVSRAFNNYSDISENTRTHVLKVAEELGYQTNISKNYNSDKNYRIAILVEDSEPEDYFIFDILMAFKSIVSESGYETILLNTTTDMQKNKDLGELLKEKQVDGALILGLKMTDEYYKQLQEIKYPCVLQDIQINNPKVGCFGIDNIKGSIIAVEHLIKLGHKKIGFINGHEFADVSYERLDGYYAALSRHRLKFENNLIVNGDFSFEGGKKAALEIVNKNKDVTAIYCASDLMACGAIEGLKSKGYKIPEDISIVGFDNIDMCNYITPKLTTIFQDKEKIGRAAGNLIMAIMNESDLGRIIIEPKLIIRESSIQIK